MFPPPLSFLREQKKQSCASPWPAWRSGQYDAPSAKREAPNSRKTAGAAIWIWIFPWFLGIILGLVRVRSGLFGLIRWSLAFAGCLLGVLMERLQEFVEGFFSGSFGLGLGFVLHRSCSPRFVRRLFELVQGLLRIHLLRFASVGSSWFSDSLSLFGICWVFHLLLIFFKFLQDLFYFISFYFKFLQFSFPLYFLI